MAAEGRDTMLRINPGHWVNAAAHRAQHPKHVRAAADQDARNDMRMGDDLIHLAQFVFRVLTWPARLLLRLARR
jgi:hypothetical protein